MFINIFNTNKKYDVIYADPPWEYRQSGSKKNARGMAKQHYKTYRTHLNEQSIKLNELNALICGITADGILEEDEIYFLQNWLDSHINLKGNYPYDRIYSVLERVLEDKIIDQAETKELLQLLQDFVDGKITSPPTEKINITNKVFVLTGDFRIGEKGDIIEFLEEKGALNKSGVSQKVDYLIVGDMGSSNWSAGNYGNKVKKAKELQAKGHNIMIMSENDFFKNLE